MRNRCRSNTGLIGECRATDALNQNPNKTSVHRFGVEGAADDSPKSSGNRTEVGQDDPERTQNVDADHKWNNLIGHFGNGLDATQNHHTHHQGHQNTEHPTLTKQDAGFSSGYRNQLLSGLVDLHHVASTK